MTEYLDDYTLLNILDLTLINEYTYKNKIYLKTVCKRFSHIIDNIKHSNLLTNRNKNMKKIIKYYTCVYRRLHSTQKDSLYSLLSVSKDNVQKAKISLILGDIHLIKKYMGYCCRFPWLLCGYSNLLTFMKLRDMVKNINISYSQFQTRYDRCILWACQSNNIEILRYMKYYNKLDCANNITIGNYKFYLNNKLDHISYIKNIKYCLKNRNDATTSIMLPNNSKYVQYLLSRLPYEDEHGKTFILRTCHGYINIDNLRYIKDINSLYMLLNYKRDEEYWLSIVNRICSMDCNVIIVRKIIDDYLITSGGLWIYRLQDYKFICKFLREHGCINYETYEKDILLSYKYLFPSKDLNLNLLYNP
ncbi:Hypothetical protein ORPV_899 [Orpheovirus IHUMI-LCC2]|uniref:Uncharacterized protein n=1 Tax=Orpheovirus IHUMI-LCC2 TaxID=2023057 RepID=A0A2I2L5J1_9VIRU|nr:Hypothetical protein ORPV_899 [Orpheovirus IHUMI-LCC2]SNW62803.1 Hypothetical protein ORPV_899 [Orpheovirus IHUMI-LCC2]